MSTTITLRGRLGQDPEVRFTRNGDAVCNFTVAVTPRKREGNEWVDEPTMWFPVTCWKRMAEGAAELRKGAEVVVTGRLANDTWTDRQSGEERSRLTVNADTVARVVKADRPPNRTARAGQDASPPF